MFDSHIHSRVSNDGREPGLAMALSAKEKGLEEICFTDHMDYIPGTGERTFCFTLEDYSREYDDLEVPGLKIRRGMEFGMTPDNAQQFVADAGARNYDFILGSVHYVGREDVYFDPYWQGKTVFEAERVYLEHTLKCIQAHDGFDVLAHLNFLSKAPAHHAPRPLPYEEHGELIDAILEILVRRDKGLEMNTSGIDRGVDTLPNITIFHRFKELGGKIVTVGSDAHTLHRVGKYCAEAQDQLTQLFGGVCTFVNRQPVFHK